MTAPTTQTPIRPIHRVAKELVANTGFLLGRLGFQVKARFMSRLEQAGFEVYDYSVLAILAEGESYGYAILKRVRALSAPRPASSSKGARSCQFVSM